MTTSKIEWPSLIFGITFLVITGGIIFLDFIHTGMQYWLTRIFASIGFALLITGIFKGTIQTKINIPGIAITATGTFAFFLLLYFSNPAKVPEYPQPKKTDQVIKINNNTTKVIKANTNLNVHHNNIVQTNSNYVVQNGNNNRITINPSKKAVDFLKPFLIEGKSNLPLLHRLSDMHGDDLQELAHNPKYLNIHFINSFDIYQEIQDEQTINDLVELLNILEDINIKIKNLHDASNNMLLKGTWRDVLSATNDFHTVSKDSERAISLYEQISSSYAGK